MDVATIATITIIIMIAMIRLVRLLLKFMIPSPYFSAAPYIVNVLFFNCNMNSSSVICEGIHALSQSILPPSQGKILQVGHPAELIFICPFAVLQKSVLPASVS